MNSVSNQAINAAQQAKKLAKSALSSGPTEEGGQFGDMLSSMQMGLQGQDLAAQTGKASPPAEGLASEVLGPAVHIITSNTATMNDESLFAFARSQGMDESSLALIFQHAAPATPTAPATPVIETIASADPTPLSALTDSLAFGQQASALKDGSTENVLPVATVTPAPLEPTTDANGMSVLDLGADGSMRWSVNQPGQLNAAENKTDALALADSAAKLAKPTGIELSTAAAQQQSQEAPAENLAATLILGAGEAAQFAKRVQTKQVSQRAEKIAALTGESFKSVAAKIDPSTISLIEDATDDGQEAHVGHAVGLVDHDDADIAEVDVATLDQILEPAGAGDEDVNATTKRVDLRAVASAAVDGSDLTATGFGERLHLAADLIGKLAGWREDEGGGTARLGGRHTSGNGEAESDRLAGARGGSASHVATRDCVRNGRSLDRERRLDSLARQHGCKVGGHAEVNKRTSHETPFEQRACSR